MAQIKFNYMYGPGVVKTGQDLSRTMEDVFEELPPFAMDAEGNFLNKSSFPKIVKTGQVNVDERIQSYADEVDIYKILERMVMSGESLPEPKHDGLVYDYSKIPDNIHDFEKYISNSLDSLARVSPELAKVILSDGASEAEIKAAINNYVDTIRQANVVKKDEVNE